MIEMDCWIARAIHLCDASAGAGAEVRVCLSSIHCHRTLLRQALNSLIGITLPAVAYSQEIALGFGVLYPGQWTTIKYLLGIANPPKLPVYDLSTPSFPCLI